MCLEFVFFCFLILLLNVLPHKRCRLGGNHGLPGVFACHIRDTLADQAVSKRLCGARFVGRLTSMK